MADFEAARAQWERDYGPQKPEPIRYAPGYLEQFQPNPSLHTPEQLRACPVCSPKRSPLLSLEECDRLIRLVGAGRHSFTTGRWSEEAAFRRRGGSST